MSLTAKIAYNTGIQVVGRLFSVVFGLLSVALLTRYLGTSGYGQYIIVIAFVQFFGVLADMGLYMISVKKISHDGADVDSIFSNIFTLRLVTALFFVLLAPAIVLFFPYPPIVKWGVVVATSMNLFVTLSQLLTGLYQKSLAMSRSALSEVIGKLVTLGLVFACVFGHLSLLYVLAAFVIGAFVQFIIALAFSGRWVRIRLRFDWRIWQEVLAESWPIALTIALNIIYFRADTIILAIFKTSDIVGVYGAGYKVLEVIIAFPAMFAGLVMPLITRAYAAGDHERFQATLQKGFDFMATIALPMVAGVFVLAHPLMTLVAGQGFALSGSILRVLIFATGSIFFGVLFGNTVVAVGKQRAVIPLYAAVAIGSLIGYGLLIPRYSVWGAAGVTVATEFAITLGSLYVVWRATKIRLSLTYFFRVLFCALVMATGVWYARHMEVLLAGAIGVVLYALALLATRTLTRAQIRELLPTR